MFRTTSRVSRVEIPGPENLTLLGVVLELPASLDRVADQRRNRQWRKDH